MNDQLTQPSRFEICDECKEEITGPVNFVNMSFGSLSLCNDCHYYIFSGKAFVDLPAEKQKTMFFKFLEEAK